jgi:hypothetical protein
VWFEFLAAAVMMNSSGIHIVLSSQSQLTFHGDVSPPFWWLKSQPSYKPAWSKAKSTLLVACFMLASCLTYQYSSVPNMELNVPAKHWLTFTRLHGAISQNTWFFWIKFNTFVVWEYSFNYGIMLSLRHIYRFYFVKRKRFKQIRCQYWV